MDYTRVMNCSTISVSELEGKRLEAIGVSIPPLHTSGTIKYEGKVIGYANDFNGICFTDKEFILKHIVSIQWYIN